MSIEDKNSNELVRVKYICANSNTTLHCADYNKRYKCMIYGSNNLIHVYNPSEIKTYLTLKGHSNRVNVIKFIDNKKEEGNQIVEILSGGADGKIIHWINESKKPFDYLSWKIEKEYIPTSKVNNESLSINALDILYINKNEKYFTFFTSTGFLELYYFNLNKNEFCPFNKVNMEKSLQDCVSLLVLDNNYILLLTGGYDRKINIHTIKRVKNYEEEKNLKEIQFCVSLLGHGDDIRDISSICEEIWGDITKNKIMFSSCSQDNYIRIWNVTKLEKNYLSDMANKINKEKTNSIYDEYKSKTSYVIQTKNITNEKGEINYYNITLESILSGHEDSVSSIQWGTCENEFILLSSSLDFSVGIWFYDKKYKLWDKKYSLGEMLGNKHAFFYASFLESYKEIIAYSFHGSFYFWKMNEENKYEDFPIVHGHFGTVTDIRWDPTKNILFSCSQDETTRAFAYWKRNDSWHEINRPQIHGYSLNNISCINNSDDNTKELICKIVSCSEEKILRVFNPPFNIIKFLNDLSEKNIQFKKENNNDYYEKIYINVEGSKQALGLMNKEVILENDIDNENNKDESDFSKFDPDAILTNKTEQVYNNKYNYKIPPNEDFLANNTLWPEESKLYGHGDEIYCIDVSHDSKILASAQKAQEEKNALLYLWDINSKKIIDKLKGNTLTIAQIIFSPTDKYILTVSRDRSFNIYIKTENNYKLIQTQKNAHKRIIWGGSWTIDDKFIITVSRDKFITIWSNKDNKFIKVTSKEMKESITSVECIKKTFFNNIYVFIIGLESGHIIICCYDDNKKILKILYEFNKFIEHCLTIKKIRSFIQKDDKNYEKCLVATCSEDFSTRIFEINIKEIENLIFKFKDE